MNQNIIDDKKFQNEIIKLSQLDRIEFRQKLIYYHSCSKDISFSFSNMILMIMISYMITVIFYSLDLFLFVIWYTFTIVLGILALIYFIKDRKKIVTYIWQHYEEYFDINKIIKKNKEC